jgi:hypothetical protein
MEEFAESWDVGFECFAHPLEKADEGRLAAGAVPAAAGFMC